ISVECSPVRTISFVSTPSLGMKFHAMDEPLTGAAYPGRPGETYVRVEVTDIMGRTAWSNPIYNET
ncbi:PHP domain-containing protein, partial [Candidatus Bathyarchaeota archaeon]|nr:PHP domain-containing protein [Candidatus Bathyarchaeota archaeon]